MLSLTLTISIKLTLSLTLTLNLTLTLTLILILSVIYLYQFLYTPSGTSNYLSVASATNLHQQHHTLVPPPRCDTPEGVTSIRQKQNQKPMYSDAGNYHTFLQCKSYRIRMSIKSDINLFSRATVSA